MDATLRALGEILLKAAPTFVLVLLLYLYLTRVFFRPLEEVLRKRYEANEGARKLAEDSLAKAEAKTQEYEASMRKARGQVYHELGELRRQLQTERTAAVEEARQRAETQIAAAKADLEREVTTLKQSLAGESEVLANKIAESVLRRSAA
ncbi:MAG: ATP synthase F0 subunit B [Acidobacteriia bacterium]|nr:ATP synthase F0 subunit B [Terriglobia bacterium]